MNIEEIRDLSEKTTKMAELIRQTEVQLESIKVNYNEGCDISMKIEDCEYLDFSKEEVVLFLTKQLAVSYSEIKTLINSLIKLI